jgi:hypothetical protein
MLEALSLPPTSLLPTPSPLKLDYLAELCNKLNIGDDSRRAAFALTLRVSDDILSMSVCLSIASKLYDLRPVSMKTLASEIGQPLHTLLDAERKMLRYLEFRVSQTSLHDWLNLLLELCNNLVKTSKAGLLSETAYEIADFLYSCPSLFSSTPVALLAAGTIQASLMLLTGMSGEFSLTRLLSVVLGEDRGQIEALGKQVFALVIS